MAQQEKFEEAFEALKKAVAAVESKDATLDDAIAAFEKGMSHYTTCLRILDEAQQRIKVVMGGFEKEVNEDDGF
jgi:exodeoxyribonuclease VII small subunit